MEIVVIEEKRLIENIFMRKKVYWNAFYVRNVLSYPGNGNLYDVKGGDGRGGLNGAFLGYVTERTSVRTSVALQPPSRFSFYCFCRHICKTDVF